MCRVTGRGAGPVGRLVAGRVVGRLVAGRVVAQSRDRTRGWRQGGRGQSSCQFGAERHLLKRLLGWIVAATARVRRGEGGGGEATGAWQGQRRRR